MLATRKKCDVFDPKFIQIHQFFYQFLTEKNKLKRMK